MNDIDVRVTPSRVASDNPKLTSDDSQGGSREGKEEGKETERKYHEDISFQ